MWNAQSDPEAHAWFNNGRAARFKSFDFGRFCATVLQLCATVLQLCAIVLQLCALYFNYVQLYFNFVQLYLCAKFCWNLWLWLILWKQPIKPAPLPLIRRAEQPTKQLHPAHTMWTSASHIVHPCIPKLLHFSASEPLCLAVTCIQFEKIACEHVDHCWSNLFALLEQLPIACSQLPIAHRAAA